ncbi:MAG: sugar phosphate isomerase/epimerase [Woeseiaceae bacterium]|nr:sugar phosphate isomerase/epimerase [Woeseiaceae bacterium]
MPETRFNRREWLVAAGAAGVAVAAGMPREAKAKVNRQPGLQLYTLRDSMAENVEKTLQAVAGIGYREVEFAGYFDHSPAEISKLLERYELASPSTHASGQDVRENAEAIVGAAVEVGHRYVTIAWMPEDLRRSTDDWHRWAEDANRLGELCRRHGLRAAYHNHDFEFQAIDGTLPFDVLMTETDPELVDFELDFYWVRKAGRGIRDVLAMAPERFTMAHIKDIDDAGNITDVGAGDIDFAGLLADPLAASIRHPFVEHDNAPDPFRSVAISHYALKAALE